MDDAARRESSVGARLFLSNRLPLPAPRLLAFACSRVVPLLSIEKTPSMTPFGSNFAMIPSKRPSARRGAMSGSVRTFS